MVTHYFCREAIPSTEEDQTGSSKGGKPKLRSKVAFEEYIVPLGKYHFFDPCLRWVNSKFF